MAKRSKSTRLEKAEPALSKELQEAFAHFLNCNPPKLFCRNLRDMVIELVAYQKGNYRDYLAPLLLSLEMLFEVLDQAEDEEEKKTKDI